MSFVLYDNMRCSLMVQSCRQIWELFSIFYGMLRYKINCISMIIRGEELWDFVGKKYTCQQNCTNM